MRSSRSRTRASPPAQTAKALSDALDAVLDPQMGQSRRTTSGPADRMPEYGTHRDRDRAGLDVRSGPGGRSVVCLCWHT